tara:strand:- start:2280 stop:3191 length:912 start_codon:yes stop_codon:yes gene_type:complete
VIKSKQFQSIFFLLLKLGVLSLLIYFLYHRISSLPGGFKISGEFHFEYLLVLILLMPLNLLFEWQKWTVILKDERVETKQKFHSFLSGIVSGVITPAYAGNFIGRMFYFPKSSRKNIVVNTLVSNGAQFIISIALGIVALQVLYFNAIEPLLHLLLLIINVGLFVLFFFGDLFLHKISIRFLKQIKNIVISKTRRGQLVLLSLGRYIIFVLQFFVALLVFDASFDLELLLWIMLMFGAITISPSLFMGKLIVRETVAVTVLSLIAMPAPLVIMAATSTWLLNQIIPALMATLLVKKQKHHAWI